MAGKNRISSQRTVEEENVVALLLSEEFEEVFVILVGPVAPKWVRCIPWLGPRSASRILLVEDV